MKISALILGGLLAAVAARAGAATMDFAGLQPGERPLAFYDGGAGSLGSVGGPQRDFGVTFRNAVVACNLQFDCERGGDQSVLVFAEHPTLTAGAEATSDLVNVEGGFHGMVAFTFATPQAGFAEFWSGLDGTGVKLGVIALGTNNCPEPAHCAFRNIEGAVDAGQVAHSIRFAGVSPDLFAIDNLSLDLADSPISGAPEPAAWALAVTGFALAGAGLRHRRRLSRA